MKFAKLSIIALLTIVPSTTVATQYKFVASDKSPTTKVCVAAVENNLLRYMRTVKNNGFNYQVIANHLKCNNQNIADFASTYNSTRTAKFINAYRKNSVSFTEIAHKIPEDSSDNVIVITVSSK